MHLIANNQIGFTTDPADARSTRYASDLAKGFDVPIVHVNADDVDACIAAVHFAVDFRRAFGARRAHRPDRIPPLRPQRTRRTGVHPAANGRKDQEPSDRARTLRQQTRQSRRADRRPVARDGRRSQRAARRSAQGRQRRAGDAHDRTEDGRQQHLRRHAARAGRSRQQLDAWTDGTRTRSRGVSRSIANSSRRSTAADTTIAERGTVDWGTAEALAFASLLTGETPIRLTGQDTERGTFSHRHAVFHDVDATATWIPLQHLAESQASFEIRNSPLSEYACVGFEYGYSTQVPGALVLWEAQYGDFFNGAQIVVDQFIAAGQAKWGQYSRLTSCCFRTATKAAVRSTRARVSSVSCSSSRKEISALRTHRTRATTTICCACRRVRRSPCRSSS